MKDSTYIGRGGSMSVIAYVKAAKKGMLEIALFVLILSIGIGSLGADRQALHATSTEVDRFGLTEIIAYWQPQERSVGYNLYRKGFLESSYPSIPINGKQPIRMVETCDELKSFVPAGSVAWEMLQAAFYSILPKKEPGESSAPFLPKAETTPMELIQKFPRVQTGLILRAATDPCTVIERGLTEQEQELFDVLAMANLDIRLARGWGFTDSKVEAGRRYTYQLRAVLPNGSELIVGPEVDMEAGVAILPGFPTGLTATPGDNKVLLLWNRNLTAYSYLVRRAKPFPYGFYQVINEEQIIFDLTEDLDGDPITSPRPGFVDFQRFDDETGLPTTHEVGGVAISGPENGTTYYYQVASCDILGRVGPWSTEIAATPVDTTPPKAPTDVSVDPTTDSTSPGLVVSWHKVTEDINGHRELASTQAYRIYRADSLEQLDDISHLSSYLVATTTADPTDSSTMNLSFTDNDPGIVPTYGEKDYWYRITCVDASPAANASAPSAAISGRVPDRIPPGGTWVIDGEGYADHIRVYWQPNTEPDLAGYQIYRSICDFGKPYVPPDQPNLTEYRPDRLGCDFTLVGEILVGEARRRTEETGNIYFDDYSVPADSPVCYSYWVRAFDLARNLYPGKLANNCPDDGEYICQRLYEETPPPAPIISGLKAKSNAVLIEWISSPVQDLYGFHIYRSKDELSAGDFVACVLLDGTVKSERWKGTEPDCEDIPADPDPSASFGSYLDKGLDPHEEFWYRVSGVDWLGNESEGGDISKIPAISTFTYTADRPAAPTVLPPTSSVEEGCGLHVRWQPAYDPNLYLGFVVFRSISTSGPYHQVSSVLSTNEFLDTSAIHGISYWYVVQAIDKEGMLSAPSAPVEHSY
jgi:hypothetical protein